ncbi:MAG: membrane protein insertase YidC [Candidatus Tectimicrobiota bacterium]
MEKRAILAIVLSLLVVAAWSIFFAPAPPSPPVPELTTSTPKPAGDAGTSQAPGVAGQSTSSRPDLPPAETATASLPETVVTVHTGVSRIVLTSQGAGVKAVQLQEYHTTLAKGAPPIEIAPVPGAKTFPLTAELHLDQKITSFGPVVFSLSQTELQLSANQPEGSIAFRGQLGNGLTVHRVYRFSYGKYTFDVSTRLEGPSAPTAGSLVLLWGPGLLRHTDDADRQGQTAEHPRSYVNGKIVQEAPAKVGEKRLDQGQVTWTALGDTYFTAALLPQEPAGDAVLTRRLEGDVFEIGLRTPLSAERLMQTVRVYVGPKLQPLLESVEPSLGKVIDLGFFAPLARPMMQFLRWINGVVHNYGITIILVTVLIKIAFWPLTQASYKSMQAMQKLQPKLKELQVVYKDDRQGLNRAMMDMYRENRVNPMGGCLPMVLQIPVFFAFYNALLYAVELRHTPFVCWENEVWWVGRGICDLSVYDPSYITPALMGVSMFIQQKMTPMTTMDPTQAKIMQFMPLMFLVFFIKAPSGLVIYWLVNNILSIVQQMLINKKYATGATPAETPSRG